jgi:homoserine O-succinyltransferase
MTANARNGLALANGQWRNRPQQGTLQVAVLNLMPTKLTTELQFLKRFDNLATDVTVSFLYPASHHFKGIAPAVIKKHYLSLAQVQDNYFDGLVVTGAPVEQLPFEAVDYWQEFRQILTWAQHHVCETLFECWAAQAGLFIDFAIQKRQLASKLFGVYAANQVNSRSRLARDFGAGGLIKMPQSRHSASVLDPHHLPGDLAIIAASKGAGPLILRSHQRCHTYITGHPEYDRDTLAKEYYRDQKKRRAIHAPQNYFINGTGGPVNYSWQDSAQLIYQNWFTIIKQESRLLI